MLRRSIKRCVQTFGCVQHQVWYCFFVGGVVLKEASEWLGKGVFAYKNKYKIRQQSPLAAPVVYRFC